MIVCSCNLIVHREIEATADRLYKAEPGRKLTPGQVYRALGKRPRCSCCLALANKLIQTRLACLRNQRALEPGQPFPATAGAEMPPLDDAAEDAELCQIRGCISPCFDGAQE